MYTVSTRAPSKIASKAVGRGSTAQQINLFESREREPFCGPASGMSSPRPVFNGKKSYGRQNSNPSNHPGSSNATIVSPTTQDPCTPQHEDNVRYVAEAWQKVNHELNHRRSRDDGPEYYRDTQPLPYQLREFEPFDLDQWLTNRTVERLKNSA